jgi:hypothetical protein
VGTTVLGGSGHVVVSGQHRIPMPPATVARSCEWPIGPAGVVVELPASTGPYEIAALDEVMAFLPAGASTVPESAFFSPQGLRFRSQYPGQFRRRRLEALREAYAWPRGWWRPYPGVGGQPPRTDGQTPWFVVAVSSRLVPHVEAD